MTSKSLSFLSLSALFLVLSCSDDGPPGTLDGAVPGDSGEGSDGGTGDDAGAREDGGVVDAGDSDAGPLTCPPPPACDAAPPDYGPMADWRHSVRSPTTVALGGARHRGRDLVLTSTADQWVIAKIAYGATDKDLEDEDVDIHLLRGCEGTWELLGTAATTEDSAPPHSTVERIADDGGRVFFQIPESARLGVGRHRIHLVVKGDHTHADMYIDVVGGPTAYLVTDVDGTLTESETAEWTALLGATVTAQPSAPEALAAAVDRGYRVFYLTARPDWLTTRTHEWLAEYGFPLGIVHTTNNGIGALGGAAVTFKTEEIVELAARTGGPPGFAIGNTDSDAEAYRDTGIDADGRYLYQLSGDPAGGIVFDDYADLVSLFEDAPLVCR